MTTFPHLHLLVSGGNSQIIWVENWQNWQIIGQTQDDAAGECLDKIGRMLGLDYPGGVWVSRVAGLVGTNLLNFPISQIKNANSKISDQNISSNSQSLDLSSQNLIPTFKNGRIPKTRRQNSFLQNPNLSPNQKLEIINSGLSAKNSPKYTEISVKLAEVSQNAKPKNYNFSFSGLKTAVRYFLCKQKIENWKLEQKLTKLEVEILLNWQIIGDFLENLGEQKKESEIESENTNENTNNKLSSPKCESNQISNKLSKELEINLTKILKNNLPIEKKTLETKNQTFLISQNSSTNLHSNFEKSQSQNLQSFSSQKPESQNWQNKKIISKSEIQNENKNESEMSKNIIEENKIQNKILENNLKSQIYPTKKNLEIKNDNSKTLNQSPNQTLQKETENLSKILKLIDKMVTKKLIPADSDLLSFARILQSENLPKLELFWKVCVSAQSAVMTQLCRRLEESLVDFLPCSLGISGGVSANLLLRQNLQNLSKKFDLEFFLPPLFLTGDNAVMIALAGIGDLWSEF